MCPLLCVKDGLMSRASLAPIGALFFLLDLNPDVVVLGFAMNEPRMVGINDKHASTGENLVHTLSSILNKSESFKLLRYWVLLLRWKPRPIGEYLEDKSYNATWREQMSASDFDKFDPWMRDSRETTITIIAR